MKYLLIFIVLYIFSASGQLNECYNKKSCSECISSSPKCTWCADKIYQFGEKKYFQRCNYMEEHLEQKCQNISSPNSKAQVKKALPLQGETRVSPQKIHLKLRPGQSVDVKVNVKTPVDFPVDLYYLMDLSESMGDDLVQIQDIGELLATQMKSVTSNFRLGFGGFVDKPVNPFTFVREDELSVRREDARKKVTGKMAQNTFSYKNYLSLTEDAKQFENVLKNDVNISFNVDEPEGSLDALVQVMACKDQIGWRDKKKARRIIIITTDATFHFSGDGIIGGFVKPNDGQCYTKDGWYSGWDKFDYPSLSQIRKMMIDNQMVPIFATTGNTDLYQQVAAYFGDASGAVAQKLKNDSSNVVPLIKEAYEKIAKLVSIKSNAPNGIDVNFKVKCKADGDLKDGSLCDNIELGDEVIFKAEISASDCNIAKNSR